MHKEIVENLCYLFWDISSSPTLRALSPSPSHPSALQYSSFVLIIVTCILGYVTNITVIFVTGFLMKKNKYKIWFLNLALADFTFLLLLPLYAVSVIRGTWSYGSSVCKLYNFFNFVNMYASIYILTALNIDRALSVAKPIWHLKFHSWTFCCCICALIWVTSALCSIPAIIYSDVHEENLCTLSYSDSTQFAYISYDLHNSLEEFRFFNLLPREICSHFEDVYNISANEEFLTTWREITFTAMRLVVPLAVIGYGIPLCVILASNIIIAHHVKNSKMAATSRLYRVVIVAVMGFFCTRTPYVLAYIMFLVSVSTMKLSLMYKLSIALPLLYSIAATNSLLNPMVYVLVAKEVRREIIKVFKKKSIQL